MTTVTTRHHIVTTSCGDAQTPWLSHYIYMSPLSPPKHIHIYTHWLMCYVSCSVCKNSGDSGDSSANLVVVGAKRHHLGGDTVVPL